MTITNDDIQQAVQSITPDEEKQIKIINTLTKAIKNTHDELADEKDKKQAEEIKNNISKNV